LYHYSNVFDQNSIEPSYQVIKEVIKGIGFQLEVSVEFSIVIYLVINLIAYLNRKKY
jgi:hypothetical protein